MTQYWLLLTQHEIEGLADLHCSVSVSRKAQQVIEPTDVLLQKNATKPTKGRRAGPDGGHPQDSVPQGALPLTQAKKSRILASS